MPKTLRSPPAPSKQHFSESDAVTVASDEEKTVEVGRRNKRRRGVVETTDRLEIFREEVMTMLTEIKANQESCMNSMSKLTSDVADLKKRIDKIQLSSNEVEKAVEFLSNQQDSLRGIVDVLDLGNKDNIAYMNSLERQIEDMQRTQKSSMVEIRNIPNDKSESKMDMTKIVEDTCRVLKVELIPNDIRDIYKLKNKNGIGTIFTNFATSTTKNKVIAGVKTYNKLNANSKLSTADIGMAGKSVPIYVSESLTIKGKRLYYMARDVAKTSGYKYCWTNHGRVYLRKMDGSPHIEVKDEVQLDKLNIQV